VKTLHIVRLRGLWVGNKGALSCLAVRAAAFSTLQLNAGACQALPGASWTCPRLRTCPLWWGWPGRLFGWGGCVIFARSPYLLPPTISQWSSHARKTDLTCELQFCLGSRGCFTAIFKTKWILGALSPKSPGAGREELVITASEPPSLCFYLHSNYTTAGIVLGESPLLFHLF